MKVHACCGTGTAQARRVGHDYGIVWLGVDDLTVPRIETVIRGTLWEVAVIDGDGNPTVVALGYINDDGRIVVTKGAG